MDINSEKKALLGDLAVFNEKVTAVLAERKSWMDAHMADFAKVPIGEEIYNLDTGQLLGVVSKHYRYWDSQQNPLYDTTMDICCEYQTQPDVLNFDNTSRQLGLRYGTKSDLDTELAWKQRPHLIEHDWEKIFV